MEGNITVNLVLYTHALQIVLSGPFTCELNTVRFVTKSCLYNFYLGALKMEEKGKELKFEYCVFCLSFCLLENKTNIYTF